MSVVSLDLIRESVTSCERCPELASTRTKTVFGSGPMPSRLMFIGEAPGADEDKSGEPFVGQAGRLLTNILSACRWTRDTVYIANILKCRPPGNRRPTTQEAANCRGYLDAQIDAVNPEWIVCLGATAASNLLNVEPVMGPLRGRVFTYKDAKVVCTYHPAYLLRNNAAKKDVWQDLQVVIAGLNREGTDGQGVVGHQGSDKAGGEPAGLRQV